MHEKLLTICVPTFNRRALLEKHLHNVFSQLRSFSSNDVEVVVSVNPSNDGTEEMVVQLKEQYDFVLNINKENIGGTKNILKLFSMAKGKYVWIAADDDILVSGLIEKVVTALREHKDITWLFMNAARTHIDKTTGNEVLTESKCYLGEGGYYKNGLKKLTEVFYTVDNRLLFSTANVYLRDAAREIMEDFPKENNCRQLAYIYNSIGKGAAYIIAEPSIVAGCEITWKDRYYETEVRNFNNALLKIGELKDFDRGFAVELVRYRMTHEAIDVWFEIFKMILKQPKVGFKDYKFYYKLMPGTTIRMTLLAPAYAVYLLIRHSRRTKIRKAQLVEVKTNPAIPIELKEKCL